MAGSTGIRPSSSAERPSGTRMRSSTLVARPGGSRSSERKVSQTSTIVDPSASTLRSASSSGTTTARTHASAQAGPSRHRPRPLAVSPGYPDPPSPTVHTSPSVPEVHRSGSIDHIDDDLFPNERATLALYTYKPSITGTSGLTQPSPLPSTSSHTPSSSVQFNYSSLPFRVRPGEYLEIRRIRLPQQPRAKLEEGAPKLKSGGEALKGVPKFLGRDGYVFRAGEDAPNVPVNQIQVPDSVATAFRLQHRSDVEVLRLPDPSFAHIDHFELRFSQYLGRADMWRLGMSLEGQTVHVGEKINLAGGAIRAEVHAIWRGGDRYSSGIVTSKSKTIYRSRSAQVYIFIQLCQETWQFDEDGERYYEKVVHSFLPDLFARWGSGSASHLVTIILFGRVTYHPNSVAYIDKNNLTLGFHQNYAGKWCKDFFRVVYDFERRSDWVHALPEIKKALEKSEKEILMDFHLGLMEAQEGSELVQKKILGRWSFAYDGNVLEAVNLALNPFDEHHIDRDLSRTGLNMTVISPGTGHFAVDKNLLRLTTERMVDHGISLDLVCLTKMPLHSVPLFSYVSKRPKTKEGDKDGSKTGVATPDLLYFDAHLASATDVELADCYSIPKWVNASFYSRTADKPFRDDRFIPRCKMYEIQMLGILDHNLTTVTVPLLDADDNTRQLTAMTAEERKKIRDDFDSATFGGKKIEEPNPKLSPPAIVESRPSSLVASYQSARLIEQIKKDQQERSSDSSPVNLPTSPRSPSRLTVGWSPHKSPHRPLIDVETLEPLDLQRTEVRAASPVPSTLSMNRVTMRSVSPSRSSTISSADAHTHDTGSGQSTPRVTPGKRLRNKSSRGSFASRFGPNWLFGAFGGRSQPSYPAAAAETVSRQDVSLDAPTTIGDKSGPPSPVTSTTRRTPNRPRPMAVPGAVEVQPPTPSPHRDKHLPDPPLPPSTVSGHATQPVPIAPRPKRTAEDEISKSLRNSVKFGKSPNAADSWGRSADLGRASRHVTVNPCDPRDNVDPALLEGRRWQHIRPKPLGETSHLMKWTSLCAPACLPLTTDYLPTAREISDFYEVNSYEIACFSDQVSFLIRPDVAVGNLALAVMREMASQRLTQNFQYIVLPHDTEHRTADLARAPHRKILASGESMGDDLKIGGASEALRDPDSVIYLLLSHHIHRLSCDTHKQSVTVQKFVRRLKYSTEAMKYECLVWPAQMRGFQRVQAAFNYPNIESKLGFNYLDRLINGDELELNDKVQYWRTRYILIPSGKDPLHNISSIMPKGETFHVYEVLMEGAYRVLDVFNKHCLKRSNPYHPSTPTAFHLGGSTRGKEEKPLKLIPTTWDPSACVLDEGLMAERERMFRNEEVFERGKRIEGATLAAVGEMMCKERNGLVIRDRWWHFSIHEDSFTGEQFCEWLLKTFEDIKTTDQAADWGRSLFDKGLVEHVTHTHAFYNYGHFYYRLRPAYDKNAKKRRVLAWFNTDSSAPGPPPQDPRDVIDRHAKLSTSPYSTSNADNAPIAQLAAGNRKKRKIRMSQSVVIDLDPGKRSDRAEVAVLHADIIHNARNALHFELNWLGVTAGLLDDLRSKCAAQAERFGLRFVEAPVEQISDISSRCAYRSPIPIPLALAPPIIPDLAERLRQTDPDQATGNFANYFEYKILTEKFGFVLDVESRDRYPETIQVEYLYRNHHSESFDYSQFCHKSGLALVQCIGGTSGYLWADNRLYISSPGRGGSAREGSYPGAPVPRLNRGEEARALREEMEAFCADPERLREFYDQMTPGKVEVSEERGLDIPGREGEREKDRDKDKDKEETEA